MPSIPPIVFEIHGLMGFHLEMVEYPKLASKVKWVQKGISVLDRKWPRLLGYLSRQQVLARLADHAVVLRVHGRRGRKSIQRAFSLWIRKERGKNLVFMILEALVIPFTGFLAVIPGPNIFFYVPGLLFYFHFTAWRGLRKAEDLVNDASIEYVKKARG